MPASPHTALLDGNAKWAKAMNESDPTFFGKLAKGQTPKILWFGCADSRVPESVITDARPNDIFVHRNVANQFHPDDDSALAVLSFAVGVLGVEHVILVGHTDCGGAKASLGAAIARLARSAPGDTSTAAAVDTTDTVTTTNATDSGTPLSRWLTPLTDLVASLDGIADTDADHALDRVIHENIKRQVANICDAAPVREAWAAGKSLSVHGWMFDLASGRINDLGISRGPSGEEL